MLASGGQDGFIKVFDALGNLERAKLAGPFGEVRCLAFSANGQTLASSNGGAAKLWDLASGREKASYRAHKNLLTGIAFTPDGHSLLTAGLDKTVKVWDVIP
jgi:WD40 repeat protein